MRTKPPTNPLAVFIDSKIPRPYKSRRALAQAIGMSDSGFSRAVKDPKGNLTTDQCLRLARELRVEFSTLLRLSGRHELADVAEDAHTRTVVPGEHLSYEEREVVQTWRNASALIQDMIRGLGALGQDVTRAVQTSRTEPAKRLRAHVRAMSAERERLKKR